MMRGLMCASFWDLWADDDAGFCVLQNTGGMTTRGLRLAEWGRDDHPGFAVGGMRAG